MSVSAWWDRALEASHAGEPLRIGPSEYAELVRLRLCSDPADPADRDELLFNVPLIVDEDLTS